MHVLMLRCKLKQRVLWRTRGAQGRKGGLLPRGLSAALNHDDFVAGLLGLILVFPLCSPWIARGHPVQSSC